MTSKNRITVNFKSEIYSHLIRMAGKEGPSLAGLVQRIVTAAIRNDIVDTMLLEKLRLHVTSGDKDSARTKPDVLKILYETSQLDLNENIIIILKSREIILPDYSFQLIDIEPFHHGELAYSLKEQARDKIREFIKREVPAILGQLGGVPDMLHVFIKLAKVECHQDKNYSWNFKVTPKLHVLPLFYGDINGSKLDFYNIIYRQFRDIAKFRWKQSEYERFFLIDTASHSRSGGYFIGCSWLEINQHKKEYKDFFSVNVNDDLKPKDVFCRVYIHNRDVKFKVARDKQNRSVKSLLNKY
ncbi:Uncharacterised protein [Yersinia frederiksenii]|uniref:hypothetical protein n=1 Tax=Yersinia frederiksenii TaxID=29484 RepID=UPI0005E6CDAC|nr:hypothetical protein [Yersinia frederiksenii]CFR01941.1 Uncharacterised protein [Yersinia frederiksenii]